MARVWISQYRGGFNPVSGSTSSAVSENRRLKLRRCEALRPSTAGCRQPAPPRRHRGLVELEEDALAAVLGGDGPLRVAIPGQRGQPPGQVADPLERVDPGEADERVDLAEPLHREHPGDLRSQPLASLLLGQRQPAGGVLLVLGVRVALQVAPLGCQQIDRVPGLEPLRLFVLVRRRREGGRQQPAQLLVGQLQRGADLAVKHVAEPLHVVDAPKEPSARYLDADLVGQVAGLLLGDSGITTMEKLAGNQRLDAPTSISLVS